MPENYRRDSFSFYVYRNNLTICRENTWGRFQRGRFIHMVSYPQNQDGQLYLYDIMNIKKETSNPFQSEDLTQKKTISYF
jgi:hypothetical protein